MVLIEIITLENKNKKKTHFEVGFFLGRFFTANPAPNNIKAPATVKKIILSLKRLKWIAHEDWKDKAPIW